jgi:hypothetical protein
MTDFLKKRSKLVVLSYGIVLALLVVGMLLFMINLANVHVAYTVSDGIISIDEGAQLPATEMYNTAFFNYFNNSATNYGYTATDAAQKVYDFQIAMSSLNNYLLACVCVAYICFAIMLIVGNHNRNVYYKSNLAAGILMPLVVIIMSLIALIRNFGMLGNFNENYDLYRATSFLMDPKVEDIVKESAINNNQILLDNSTRCNSLGFTIVTITTIIVIIYSALMIAYTVYRYKESTKRRNDILERAANN